MLRHVALVRTHVSEEFSASIIRVTRIIELGTLAVISNWRSVRVWFSSNFLSWTIVLKEATEFVHKPLVVTH
jgi:hypothetical protein